MNKMTEDDTFDKLKYKILRTAQAVIYLDYNDNYHRDDDQPAIIVDDGGRFWYKHGDIHRDGDQPAVILANGTMLWYVDGVPYREGDLPDTIMVEPGRKIYRKNNNLVRVDNDR